MSKYWDDDDERQDALLLALETDPKKREQLLQKRKNRANKGEAIAKDRAQRARFRGRRMR